MGTCITGGQCHTPTFGTWGRGGWRWQDIKMLYFLTHLRSELIFIKQYSDSMCFSSIICLKLRILFMWNRHMHPYLLLVLIKILLNWNLVSKLVYYLLSFHVVTKITVTICWTLDLTYFNGCHYIFLMYYYITIYVCVLHFLWPLHFGWLFVISLYKEDYIQNF